MGFRIVALEEIYLVPLSIKTFCVKNKDSYTLFQISAMVWFLLLTIILLLFKNFYMFTITFREICNCKYFFIYIFIK